MPILGKTIGREVLVHSKIFGIGSCIINSRAERGWLCLRYKAEVIS